VDIRRLLLGDWTPVVRDGIDLLRGSLLVGAVTFLAAGDSTGAAVLGALGLITLLARLVNLPRVYDLSFCLAMAVQGWGEALGAFDSVPWFDNLVHVTLPMLTAPVLYIALARLDVLPDPRDDTTTRHYVGIFVVTLALGLAVGAVWEIVEWASDSTLGSDLQLGNEDTVTDLLADSIGSLVGAALLVLWTTRSWGSVRRIPGENRFEDVDA